MSRYSNMLGDDMEGSTWGDYSPLASFHTSSFRDVAEDESDIIGDIVTAGMRASAIERKKKAKTNTEAPKVTTEKRGRGRPPGSKNKPKTHHYSGPTAF